MANWFISDSDFDKQFEQSVKNANEKDNIEPRAVKATFDKKSKRVRVDLSNRSTFIFPINMVQGLHNASEDELSKVEITPSKSGLTWDKLDVHFSILSLMTGMFGNKKWMSELGKLGGSVKSEKKRLSSINNGKKGGRPKKVN